MSEVIVEAPRDEIHGEVVYSRDDLLRRASELALRLAFDYEKVEKDLVVVPFLKGAEPFAKILEDEMTAIGFHPEFAPITISTYDENNQPVEPRLLSPLPSDVFRPGRYYLDVDDMAHTGKTMAFFAQVLEDRRLLGGRARNGNRGIKPLAHLAMIERKEQSMVEVDYHAFWTTLKDWLVGGGLDDQRLAMISADCGRYLPDVHKALTPEQLSSLLLELGVPEQ